MTAFTVSSFCSAGGCVEVGHDGNTTVVRDAKDPARAVALTFTPTAWGAFLCGVKAGQFTTEDR